MIRSVSIRPGTGFLAVSLCSPITSCNNIAVACMGLLTLARVNLKLSKKIITPALGAMTLTGPPYVHFNTTTITPCVESITLSEVISVPVTTRIFTTTLTNFI